MAVTKKPTRSHVSGFIKRFKEHVAQEVISFAVLDEKFVLPWSSTFAMVVRLSDMRRWNVLVLFETTSKKHPRITGIIELPEWKQVKAASDGAGYDEVKALRPDGKVLN